MDVMLKVLMFCKWDTVATVDERKWGGRIHSLHHNIYIYTRIYHLSHLLPFEPQRKGEKKQRLFVLSVHFFAKRLGLAGY